MLYTPFHIGLLHTYFEISFFMHKGLANFLYIFLYFLEIYFIIVKLPKKRY